MFKNISELLEFVKYENIVSIDYKACDLRGRWHHLTFPASALSETILKEGFGFDGSSYGFRKVSRSDMLLIPDLLTAFSDPFWNSPALAFICNINEAEDDEKRFSHDPRFICEKAEKALYASGAGDTLLLGPEFEFYLFDNVFYSASPENSGFEINNNDYFEHPGARNLFGKPSVKGAYHVDQPLDKYASFRAELCSYLTDMGVGIKYHHHEVGGHGQCEIETLFDTPVVMADQSMKIKYAVQNHAVRSGLTATFMPKPIFGAPGNGFHVHFQLLKNGKHVFADSDGYAGMSKTALSFMTGILVHARAISAFANPSTNSYKRLIPGYEAPVSLVLGTGNRSAAIRIPGYAKSAEDKRFEYRAGDFTANPYLMFAALILGGLDGIKKNLDPGKENVGPYDCNIFDLSDKERENIKSLPTSLSEALDSLEKDNEFLTSDGIFPEDFINNWIKTKREESLQIELKPTPAEFELYYEC